MRQDYCASKFAAVGFHESLAHELLADEIEGVKTTLVCPYIVDTGMFEGCKIRYVNNILYFLYMEIRGEKYGKTAHNVNITCLPSTDMLNMYHSVIKFA